MANIRGIGSFEENGGGGKKGGNVLRLSVGGQSLTLSDLACAFG
jgi:hypothetical protein